MSSISSAPREWRGFSNPQNITNTLIPNATGAPLVLVAGSIDTDSFWSAASPTRLTIPSGVNQVRISAGIKGAGGSVQSFLGIFKNTTSLESIQVDEQSADISSGVIDVVSGDYFELWASQNSGAAALIKIIWFDLEVIN